MIQGKEFESKVVFEEIPNNLLHHMLRYIEVAGQNSLHIDENTALPEYVDRAMNLLQVKRKKGAEHVIGYFTTVRFRLATLGWRFT